VRPAPGQRGIDSRSKWAKGGIDERVLQVFKFQKIIQTDFKCLNPKIENDIFPSSTNYEKNQNL
jgi:hypothetical protein